MARFILAMLRVGMYCTVLSVLVASLYCTCFQNYWYMWQARSDVDVASPNA
jgi:hypothetical protein